MTSTEDLIVAARKGDKDAVLGCLQRGADIDGTDQYGSTPLYISIYKKHADVAICLLEKGANPNSHYNSFTSLMEACYNGLTDVVSLLIDKGARVNERHSNGQTVLMIASSTGSKNIVVKLIEKGARVNDRDNDKWTALHCASRDNHPEVAGVLLANGADVDAVNKWGRTASDIAIRYNHSEIVDILKSHSENIGTWTEMRRLLTTLTVRVEGMEESRRANDERVESLVGRLDAVENEKRVKDGEIRALNERVIQLENHVREKDERIKELTENANKWREDHRVADEHGEQLENRGDIKEGQIVAISENLTMLEGRLAELNTLFEASIIDRDESATEELDSPGSLYSKIATSFSQLSRVAGNSTAPIISTERRDKNSDHADVKSKLFQLESKLNEAERVVYSDTLEIVGVEEKPRENLKSILVLLSRVLGLPVPEDVLEVSRFPSVRREADNGRPRVIVVKFGKAETARSWSKAFEEKRSTGIVTSDLDASFESDRIFVNRKLTSFDKRLLRRVKRFAREKEYQYVWVRDGKILLRKDRDSPVIRIKTTKDIPPL